MQLEQLDLPGGGLLTVYLRDCVETMPLAMERPLVLVVPGGGYSHLSAREGDPVALQFAAAGYHTAVLRYAVGDDAAHGLPLRQLAAAIGLVRQHAAAWHVQPDKIAVCGFSAGGHLALSGAVLAVPGLPDPPRPDAVILGYPVITAGQYAHRDSFVQLAGEDPAAQQAFSLEDKITPRTPPVFVWHTMEDETVPVENTLLLVSALHRAGVPCEAHLFEKGCHGTSLSTAEVNHPSAHRSRWLTLAREWLDDTFDLHLGTRLRTAGAHKLKEGDEIVRQVETRNNVEALFFTDKQQVYKVRLAELEDGKVAQMGIYLPGRLGMDEGENILDMVITSDYSGYMLFFFASGRCAKIPLSSYATKQNRRKLLKAYCDKEPLATMFFLPEETELAIRTSAGRMLLVGTAQIAAKTTRDSQGVAVVTLKKNQTIASVVPADTLELANPHRYRVRSLPATGALVRAEDEGEQMTML